MPFVKVYIHFVWSTKKREPLLNNHVLRKKVWSHIRKHAKDKKIHVDFISGHVDHCHCLISLGPEQTMANVMQIIKGESARWLNENKLCDRWFEWQDEYYAASVSELMLDKVREYIKRQEDHHKDKSFEDECTELMGKYAFRKFTVPPLESGGNS